MRTSIFNNFADLPKEFREDMEVLWSLPPKCRSALIPYVVEICKTATVGEKKDAMDRAVKKVGGNAADLLRALKFLAYIYRAWNPITDTPEGFVEDLAELDLIPRSKARQAEKFLLDFVGEVQKDNRRRLEKMHAGSLLPSFTGCSTLVDLRAVIDKPFGTGTHDKLEEYDPTCISFVPIIVLQVRVDSGDPDSFLVQFEEHDLRTFIEELQAALKDLESARRALPGGETI
jgi:hypothetical protein